MKLKELLINKLEEPVDTFCKKINISRPVISGIMNGTYQHQHNISLLTIKKICNYFKVDFKEYID